MHHVGEKTPPMLIMHGTADTAVHHENSVDFARKVTSHGGHAEIILYPGQRHGFFNPRSGPMHRLGAGNDTYFDRTTQEMARFIRLTVLEKP
jgi:alpha-beta hydrolase superfamily lysophospholipase